MNHTALMIENVQLGDAGRYDCTATNRFGRDDESLLLTITGNFGAALFFPLYLNLVHATQISGDMTETVRKSMKGVLVWC